MLRLVVLALPLVELELHGKLVAHLRLQGEHLRDTFFSSAADDLFGEPKAGSAAATVTVESEVALTKATSAFDESSRPRYDKLWRISVIRVIVSFLFRIAIRWINARGIWYLVAVQ